MPYDAFDAGIEPGGLRNKEEIRILICYMLYSVKEPVEKDIVINALQENGIANYFETLESFNDLAQNGNITVSEGDKTKYIVSKSGEMIALQLESSLPITVKNKAMFSAMTILNKIKIEKENTVKIKKIESGYTVSGSISGGNLDLFDFQLYVPDDIQANIVKKNFHENPERFYKIVLAALTKNKDAVADALKEIDSNLNNELKKQV